MKPTITWILIADGARARVLTNNGPGKGVQEVAGMVFTQTPLKSGDIMADRPGRSHASVGKGRSAMQPATDPVDKREADFVNNLANVLDAKLREKSFDRLIIAAAPQALGTLRNAISPQLSEKVAHEVAKDLTHIPNTEIGKHFEDVLAV